MPAHPQLPSPVPAYARFSDGTSAKAQDASVALTQNGIELRLQEPDQVRLWPYSTLRSAEPIRTHAVDVLLSSTSAPGASVFVPSPEFARALRQRAPHLTARAERWRHTRPWMIGGAAVAALFAAVYFSGWSPAKSIARVLPDSWRGRLGEQAIRSMTEGHKLCNDPDGDAALAKLAERLSRSTGVNKPFKVAVYDWSLMNAFAVPGGQVVMTRGLIEKAESPDEVAGVLAHEMGHGIELHPESSIIRAVGLASAVELMMGGSGGALANIGLVLAQLSYSRASEHEADLQALRVLKNAGISNKGLGDFFKRVEKIEGDAATNAALKPFDIFRSHPPTIEREKLVTDQAAYPSTAALNEESWQHLKQVCASTLRSKPVAPAEQD
jgi:beta-barrel assembly-enhancing protease